jgi:hypothetical protein
MVTLSPVAKRRMKIAGGIAALGAIGASVTLLTLAVVRQPENVAPKPPAAQAQVVKPPVVPPTKPAPTTNVTQPAPTTQPATPVQPAPACEVTFSIAHTPSSDAVDITLCDKSERIDANTIRALTEAARSGAEAKQAPVIVAPAPNPVQRQPEQAPPAQAPASNQQTPQEQALVPPPPNIGQYPGALGPQFSYGYPPQQPIYFSNNYYEPCAPQWTSYYFPYGAGIACNYGDLYYYPLWRGGGWFGYEVYNGRGEYYDFGSRGFRNNGGHAGLGFNPRRNSSGGAFQGQQFRNQAGFRAGSQNQALRSTAQAQQFRSAPQAQYNPGFRTSPNQGFRNPQNTGPRPQFNGGIRPAPNGNLAGARRVR